MQGQREFIAYIHAFRGVAIILVMLTHLSPPEWLFYLVQNGTMFFVVISGFLFAHLFDPKLTTQQFLIGKTRNLLGPYVLSVLPGLFYIHATQAPDNWVSYTILTVVTGTGHLNDAHWYIPFISLVFLSYPLLRILNKHPLALITVAVIWLLIGAFTFRSLGNSNPFYNLLHFGGLFPAGMVVSKFREQIEDLGSRRFGIITAISIAGFLVAYSQIPPNHLSITVEQVLAKHLVAPNYVFISKLLLIPAALLILRRVIQWKFFYAPLALLADTSFALFFWHMYVFEVLDYSLRYLAHGIPLSYGTIAMLKLLLCVAILVSSVLVLRRVFGRRSVYITG